MKTFEEIEQLNNVCNDLLHSEIFFTVLLKKNEGKKFDMGQCIAMVYGEQHHIADLLSQLMLKDARIFEAVSVAVSIAWKMKNIDLVEYAKSISK